MANRSGPGASARSTAEPMYPQELVYAVRQVVMSAAWAEDKTGELIQLHSFNNGNGDDGLQEGGQHREPSC